MMFLFAEAESAQEGAHHAPIIVRLVNQYFGEYAYNFEMKYTYPKWKWLLAKFGSTPEAAFGAYTPENAIPWYTVMFVIACILSVLLIWILKGQLSEDDSPAARREPDAVTAHAAERQRNRYQPRACAAERKGPAFPAVAHRRNLHRRLHPASIFRIFQSSTREIARREIYSLQNRDP